MPAPKYVFALDTTNVRERGSKYPTTVQRGSVWYADCDIVKDHPDLFSATPPDIHPRGWKPAAVEQATAAPGEKRNTRRAG